MSEFFESIPFAKAVHSKPHIRYVTQRPLHRVLAFTGRSIDDVVNSPIVKNEVLGYFKLQKFVQRRMEIVELEQQWNSAL
jgi:hypothetical protein